VEFALVVPIFLLLLLGIVEFARAWNVYQVLTDAAREGARRAVVADPDTTPDTIVAVIKRAGARASITIEDADITLSGFYDGQGEPSTVRVEYEHELRWVGVLMGLLSGERTLTFVTETTMRNEDSRTPPTT
jgi:Flp pilus assembly protein TadG